MPIAARRPLEDDKPDGYLESDRDFVLNNIGLCVALLEGLPTLLEGDFLSHKERIEGVYDIVEKEHG